MLQMRTMFAGWAVVLALTVVANADYVAVDYTGANITGIYDTVAGGNATVASSYTAWDPNVSTKGCYPAGEYPGYAIDGNTGTKYLSFGDNTSFSNTTATAGLNTGFHLTLAAAAKVTAIQFATGNDATFRDPLTITVEGSNATGDALLTGTNWTTIYTGESGLLALGNATTDRKSYGEIISLTNANAYMSYRVLVTSARGENGVQDAVQYSEVVLYTGSKIPEPSTTILGLSGAAGLLAYAWRKRR